MSAIDDARLQLGILSHQLALERWSEAEIRRLSRVLDANERDLIQRLGKLDSATPLRRGRLQALFSDIRQFNGKAYARLGEQLAVSLRTIAAYETTFGQRLLEAVVPRVKRQSLVPSPTQLRAIVEELPLVGSTLPKELSTLAKARFKRVQGAVRLGLVQGEASQEIVKRIVAGKRLGKVQAEALVRTAANHVSSRSRDLLYEGHGDILAGVEWVATLDGRTTPICQGLDGKVFPLNQGPRPPAHFRCRSATVPITKSWEELGFGSDMPEVLPPGVRLRPFVADTRPVRFIPSGERAGRIGQVRAEVHYSEWLAAQASSFQDAVLGPKRGAIFRANPGMDLSRLMRTTYEPMTLAELARVDGLIVEAVASPAVKRAEEELEAVLGELYGDWRPNWREPSAEEFIRLRNRSTRPGYLSPLSPDDLAEAKIFVSADGTVGAVVSVEGDVQNVFNNGGPKGAAAEALLEAIRRGGLMLDCFDDYLPKLYYQFGFDEVGRMSFNRDFAPKGWNFDRDGEPDVVFMAWRGSRGANDAEFRRRVADKRRWLPRPISTRRFSDWDLAKSESRRAGRDRRDRR